MEGDSHAIVHTFNCNRPDTRPVLTRSDKMLRNEKYVGEVLMQKTYTSDFLTGKREKNQGQLDAYLVENAHEPIIDRETFELVQRMKGNVKSKPMSSI